MIKYIPLLFLSLSICGQGFGGYETDQPFLSGGPGTGLLPIDSLLPTGISNDWDSSTTTNGIITDWVDKIQHFHWVKGTISAPTNFGHGITFTLTNQLISTNISVDLASPGHDACLAIFNVIGKNTNNFSDITLLLGNGYASGELLLGFANTTANYYSPFVGNPGRPTFDIITDFLWAGWTGGTGKAYTNGTLMVTGDWGNGGGGLGTTISVVGDAGYNSGTGNTAQFYGDLYRFIKWTNVVGFTTIQVSNIHYWAKTVYGITP